MDWAALCCKRQIAIADLLTCTEALVDYARRGTPLVVLAGRSDPAKRELQLVFDAITPSDLLPGPAALWRPLRVRAENGKSATLDAALREVRDVERADAARALSFARARGLGIAYYALSAARQLLTLAAALNRFDIARREAAIALEEAQEALLGVA